MAKSVRFVDEDKQVTNLAKGLVNHVALVIDGSGSMLQLADQVVKVTDQLISELAQRSKDTDQETRVSLYVFEDTNNIKCHTYDKDVLRMPSLRGLYRAVGMTPLIQATLKSIDDLEKTATLYGDHAFLLYVITDGGNNVANHLASDLKAKLKKLEDNWTVACFVPGARERDQAVGFGFPADNIQIWETSQAGMTKMAETIKKSVSTYYTARAAGVRGSKNLFSMDLGKLNTRNLGKLEPLHFGQYKIYDVKEDSRIDEFIETKTRRAYRLGEGYYQLVVPVKVQAAKKVAVLDKKKMVLYHGDNARKLLGLPDYEVKVAPDAHKDFDIFIQSTSVNRKLLAGQKLVVMSI